MTLTDDIILILIGLIAIADTILAMHGEETTISWRLGKLSQKWPVIPFLLGFLAGHLFFPNHALCP